MKNNEQINKSMNPTIKEMRQNGIKCRVSHKRYSDEDIRAYQPKYLKNNKDKFLVAQSKLNGPSRAAKGGECTIDISFPDGREVSGTAFCSPMDGYCKKKGLLIAIGRAVSKLNDVSPII